MKLKLLVMLLCCFTLSGGFLFLKKNPSLKSEAAAKIFPHPTNGTIINDKENDELEQRRQLWFEGMHRAAPGVDWHSIETKNMIDHAEYVKALNESKTEDAYANGNLQGTWSEHGSDNQAGRCIAVDFYKSKNALYIIGDGGPMFTGVPDSANWLSLANQYRFNNRVLKVISNGNSGTRIIAAIGVNMYYSDDNGATWTASTGVTSPYGWGGDYINQVVALNDNANTLYMVARWWDPTPWDTRFWLYRSIDRGQTWSYIYTFPYGDDNHLVMWPLTNSKTTVYALLNEDAGSTSTLYSISGNTVTVKHTTTQLPVNVLLLFKGVKVGSVTTLYALTNGTDLYTSTNLGKKWTHVSSPPAGSVLGVSVTDASKVFVGGVNAFRSSDGGTTWTQVNDWTEYYGSPQNKLHADIFAIEFFKRKNGSEFAVINCDGGCYRSDDYLQTVSNISLKGLRNDEYYDVLYDPTSTSYLFAGSQDQGYQRTSAATTPGVISFDQIISGDYGKLQLTRNSQSLWMEFPGGSIYYYNDSHNGLSNNNFTVPGSFKPNDGWMLATAPVYPSSTNKIFIAGGNTNGGDGSYLLKLSVGSAPNYNISAAQFNYDFKANSNSGTAGITAIATTSLDANKIYVAAEDGSFFYSTNGGTSWSKTTSFNGPIPYFDFGAAILASKLTANRVWFGGSGYSNPPVYKSTDGGATFNSMSNGLPSTLVFDMVTNPDETLIFAATDAGPYVYVANDDMWYPLGGTYAPACTYMACDYDYSASKVHFATFARGIWDFNITVQPKANVASASKTNENFSMNLFPNPASVNQPVHVQTNFSGEIQIRFFNLSGKMFFLAKQNAADVLDVHELKPGVYVWDAEANGERQTGKMVITQ